MSSLSNTLNDIARQLDDGDAEQVPVTDRGRAHRDGDGRTTACGGAQTTRCTWMSLPLARQQSDLGLCQHPACFGDANTRDDSATPGATEISIELPVGLLEEIEGAVGADRFASTAEAIRETLLDEFVIGGDAGGD